MKGRKGQEWLGRDRSGMERIGEDWSGTDRSGGDRQGRYAHEGEMDEDDFIDELNDFSRPPLKRIGTVRIRVVGSKPIQPRRFEVEDIVIENVGAVKELRIPYPEDGGVVELLGANGSGKSTVLGVIDSVTKKEPIDATVSDGQKRGTFEGFGVTITFGKSNRRSGECEVSGIDSRFMLSDLIEPSFKDPLARDAHRIKCLVSMSGASALEAAREYVGGADVLDELVPGAESITDPVKLVTQIKRALEKRAREVENRLSARNVTLANVQAQCADIPADYVPPDREKIQNDLTNAEVELKGILEQRKAVETMGGQLSRMRLAWNDEKQKAVDEIRSLEDRNGELHGEKEDVWAKIESLQKRHQEIVTEQCQIIAMINERKSYRENLDSMQSMEKAIAEMPCPTNQLVIETEAKRDELRTSLKEADQLLLKGAFLKQREGILSETKSLQQQSDMLREQAGNVDSVLTGIVAQLNVPLRVVDHGNGSRIVLDTKRGETYFDDLSRGEGANLAIDISIPLVKDRGLMVLDQEYWEGIQPSLRQEIHGHAKTRGAVIYTARCTDDQEIHAEVMED